MWLEFIAPALALGVGVAGIGWLKTARLLDTTTREREDLAKSALVIEVERQMLELVAKGASLSEVLDTLTRAIEQLSPESHCTIMLLDEEHRRYLSIASGPSLPPAYLQAIDRLEIGPEVGACGSAAFRNETIVIDNIATDHRFGSARDFVLSHGLRSCWSQPIRDSRNRVLGTFAIYRRKVASPRPEELRMTRVAAQLAGNAIERIRAEMHLRETIERLNLAETVARFGIWESNFQKGTMTLSAGLALMMANNLDRPKIVQIWWTGLKYADDSQTDITLSWYHQQQNDFRLPSTCSPEAGFRASCAGHLNEVSLYADHHFTKRFDAYAGIAYSNVSGGLAIAIPHGPGVPYNYNNNLAPTVGARFTF
jgi:hypothetical protein